VQTVLKMSKLAAKKKIIIMQHEVRLLDSHIAMKMVRMVKALSMGTMHAVSAMMIIRSVGSLPKIRTTCKGERDAGRTAGSTSRRF
jgi:transcription elongation factor GreA-like protein